MKTKPFCLATSKDWSLKRDHIPLMEIYTDLTWIRKHRKAAKVVHKELHCIAELLSEKELGEAGPVPILVRGQCNDEYQIYFLNHRSIRCSFNREYFEIHFRFSVA